jgi:hypothetical protein
MLSVGNELFHASRRTDGLDQGNNYVSYLCGRSEQYKIELIVALPWKQFLYLSLFAAEITQANRRD